jgi:hypothetical protein
MIDWRRNEKVCGSSGPSRQCSDRGEGREGGKERGRRLLHAPRPALDVAIDILDALVAKLRRSEGGGGRCVDVLRLGAPVQGDCCPTNTRARLPSGPACDVRVGVQQLRLNMLPHSCRRSR